MTKTKLTILLATLAVVGALVGARLHVGEHRYVVYRGFSDNVMKTLEAEGQPFHWEGKNLILTTREPEKLLDALSLAADSLDSSLQVYYQNRASKDVTKTPDGGPYQRLTPVFNESGLFVGVAREEQDANWIYDPNHPDAMIAGPNEGYVAFSTVCPLREQQLIDATDEEIRKLSAVMLKIDDNALAPESGVGMFSSLSTRDPYAGLNNVSMMTGQIPPKEGHKCGARCLTTPFPVVNDN